MSIGGWLTKTARGGLVIGVGMTLLGCAAVSGFQSNPESSATLEARRTQYYSQTSDDSYYKAAASDRQVIRDALVYGKMQVLDDDFFDFERSLNASGNTLSIGSDLTVLALNGLGATVGGTAAKSALAAASAGIVGAQGAVNKDLYYQKTLPALISQMQANREKVRLTIVQNLGKLDADYPLNAAEIDLKRLQEAGSILNAVNNISQQSTDQKNRSIASIQEERGAAFTATLPARTQLMNQIQKLTPNEALQVYKAMQPTIPSRASDVRSVIKTADPNNQAATSGTAAKSLLQIWVSIDQPDSSITSQWNNAISSATAAP